MRTLRLSQSTGGGNFPNKIIELRISLSAGDLRLTGQYVAHSEKMCEIFETEPVHYRDFLQSPKVVHRVAATSLADGVLFSDARS